LEGQANPASWSLKTANFYNAL